MATAKMIESQREGAEVYHGEAICQQKLWEILDEFTMPTNLFQLREIEEIGLNRSTGFFWALTKKKSSCKIKGIGTVYFDVQVTCFIEERHVANMTGVKAKEIFFSLPVTEVLVGVPTSDKVKFKTSTGLTRVYLISAFQPSLEN